MITKTCDTCLPNGVLYTNYGTQILIWCFIKYFGEKSIALKRLVSCIDYLYFSQLSQILMMSAILVEYCLSPNQVLKNIAVTIIR